MMLGLAEVARSASLLGIQIGTSNSSSSSTEASKGTGSSESSASKGGGGISVTVSTPLLSGVPPISVSAGPVKANVSGSTSTSGTETASPAGSTTKETTKEPVSTEVTVNGQPVAQGSLGTHAAATTTTTTTTAPSADSAKSASSAPASSAAQPAGTSSTPAPANSTVPATSKHKTVQHSNAAAAAGGRTKGNSNPRAPTGSSPNPAAPTPVAPTVGHVTQRPRHKRTTTHKSSSDPLSAIGRHIPLGIPVPDWSRPIILVLLLLVAGLGLRAFLSTRRARALEQAQSLLVNDLMVMQNALVPEIPAQLGALSISAAYRPAEGPAAGGDFYDAFTLPDGRVALILGDVSGHGHESLNQAALTRYTLRAYLEAGLEPGAALRLAGEVFSDPDFEHFATVIAGIHDPRASVLTYATAGHPPPLTMNLPGPEVLSGYASPPLGWGVPTGQRQTVLALCPQARVCFFSDGLVEARTETGLLGRDGLKSLLEDLGDEPQASDLLGAVQDHAGLVTDDMAACIIAQTGPVASASPARWEELEVDRELLSGDGPQRFLEACGVPGRARVQTLDDLSELLAGSPSARLRVRLDHENGPRARAVPSSRRSTEAPRPVVRRLADV